MRLGEESFRLKPIRKTILFWMQSAVDVLSASHMECDFSTIQIVGPTPARRISTSTGRLLAKMAFHLTSFADLGARIHSEPPMAEPCTNPKAIYIPEFRIMPQKM